MGPYLGGEVSRGEVGSFFTVINDPLPFWKRRQLVTGVHEAFQYFGIHSGAEHLVPYVSTLYDWALATSSRKTYKTGANHMKKFLAMYPRIPTRPFKNSPPNIGVLTLCFLRLTCYWKNPLNQLLQYAAISPMSNANGSSQAAAPNIQLECFNTWLKRNFENPPKSAGHQACVFTPLLTNTTSLPAPNFWTAVRTISAAIFRFLVCCDFTFSKS